MALMNDQYTYQVMWSVEDSEYVGLCVEFPILSWLAQTPEEALQGIRNVVAEVVEDIATTGEPAPAPLATWQ
jgi:predicted RNase H-like HicB family nuclease